MQFLKKYISFSGFLACCFLLVSVLNSCGQSGAKTETWPTPINLTSVIDATGVTELSGLHWNSQLNRLYVLGDNGHLHVLELNKKTNDFSQIGEFSKLGGPEGITQVDYAANEFYTIDESHYEIRRFTHNPDFTNLMLEHKWNLLTEPSPMLDTGNDGPEGIVFIPDRYLSTIGFISSETDEKYTSKKGMGGLIFIAHQKKGLIWVYDVNPDKDDDFAFVGKYKTNRNESCDLAFDRSTGLLYILHNADENTIEVTDMSATQHSGKGKFIMKTEYIIPNPKGSINIEGLAIAPKFADATNVSIWLCRDISKDEDSADRNDCLWWYKPFATEGVCVKNWNMNKSGKNK